jgi:hypothetical protein
MMAMAQAGHGTFGFARPQQAWAGGLEVFAAVMMMLIGLFHLVIGLAAILRSSFYVVTENYVFNYDVAGWGWVHLVLGIVVGITGIALIIGQTWARVVGVVLVGLSALGNFLFLPYQPLWSLLIIAVDVAVIWALVMHMTQMPPRAETEGTTPGSPGTAPGAQGTTPGSPGTSPGAPGSSRTETGSSTE